MDPDSPGTLWRAPNLNVTGERLQDRVAVVTGASSGIGAAVARALAREGAHVALAARRNDGSAQGIMAIHVWTMTPSENGVLVHTEESWDGDPVRAQPEEMQQALDGSLRAWLQSLKHKANAQGR